MKAISLTRGYAALVDDSDFGLVSKYKWSAEISNGVVYARTNTPRSKDHRRLTIRMHHLIAGKVAGLRIDHIDGNGLNNTRSNLRYATFGEQKMNSCKRKALTSRYKGVQKLKDKWMARIKVNKKLIWLGTYGTEIQAALAYDSAAVRYFGEFARTNIGGGAACIA